MAITFDRDPDQVVTPDAAAPQLLTLEDKLAFIGECGIDTSFAFYDVSLACPDGGDCRKYVPYLTPCVLQAARTNPGLRACLRYYVCRRLPRPICNPAYLNVVRAVLAILRKCPQYRLAFCRGLE